MKILIWKVALVVALIFEFSPIIQTIYEVQFGWAYGCGSHNPTILYNMLGGFLIGLIVFPILARFCSVQMLGIFAVAGFVYYYIYQASAGYECTTKEFDWLWIIPDALRTAKPN